MNQRNIILSGVNLDLLDDMKANQRKLEREIVTKQSFEYILDETFTRVKGTKSKISWLEKSVIRLGLLPQYFIHQFQGNKRQRELNDALDELERWYRKPENIILRSRFECEINIKSYDHDLNEIKMELNQLENDLQIIESGSQVKQEILGLIHDYELRLEQKQAKIQFYQACLEKINKVSAKMNVIKNVQTSKSKLNDLDRVLNSDEGEKNLQLEVQLYEEFGSLLDGISNNINKVNEDKEEIMQGPELKSIVDSIKI